jgi:hypothetical protein
VSYSRSGERHAGIGPSLRAAQFVQLVFTCEEILVTIRHENEADA